VEFSYIINDYILILIIILFLISICNCDHTNRIMTQSILNNSF